jgi:hypothetical protein
VHDCFKWFLSLSDSSTDTVESRRGLNWTLKSGFSDDLTTYGKQFRYGWTIYDKRGPENAEFPRPGYKASLKAVMLFPRRGYSGIP